MSGAPDSRVRLRARTESFGGPCQAGRVTLPAATLTRLEKVAFDNGFDQELPCKGEWLGVGTEDRSARNIVEARVPTGVLAGASSPKGSGLSRRDSGLGNGDSGPVQKDRARVPASHPRVPASRARVPASHPR